MYTKEEKKRIVEILLRAIWGVSDRKYQRRVWVKSIGPEVDDLGETIEEIVHYDELLLPDYKNYGFTHKEYKVITEFNKRFIPYVETELGALHASQFIDTPDWIAITEHAKEVVDTLGYKPDLGFKYQLSVVRAYVYFFFRKFKKYTPLETYKGRKSKTGYFNCISVITYKDLINSLTDINVFKSFIYKLTWTYRAITGAPIFYELTENQKVLLSALGKEVNTFYDSITDKKPLDYYRNSSEWKEIEALAEVVIEAFEYKPRRLKPPPGVYDYEKKLSPLELFLLNVEKVANKRYQKRVWIREVGPEWDTYYQTAKKLLKLNDPTLFNNALSKKQKEAIEKFYDLLEAFHRDSSYYPEWFINHVDWKELIAQAAVVIKAFNYKKRRGPIYWTRVFFSYIRYFLGKFKNLKLTPSPPPYR